MIKEFASNYSCHTITVVCFLSVYQLVSINDLDRCSSAIFLIHILLSRWRILLLWDACVIILAQKCYISCIYQKYFQKREFYLHPCTTWYNAFILSDLRGASKGCKWNFFTCTLAPKVVYVCKWKKFTYTPHLHNLTNCNPMC